MALANRVDPWGGLFAGAERGLWLGNRGGRFHDPESRLARARPYAAKAWICCRLSFKDRRRAVWGRGYTELFFADEVSALAAGHRPCFECRRADALAFAAAWGRARGAPPPKAPAMDAVLHAERIEPRPGYGKRLHRSPGGTLPTGAMILLDGAAWGCGAGGLRAWSYAGFGPVQGPRPVGEVQLLTPPSVVAALSAGYRPSWRMAEEA